MEQATKEETETRAVYIWVTGGIAYYESTPGVEVTLIDWDAYREGGAEDYTLEDLRTRLEDLQLMPAPTAELARCKAEAIESMQEIVNEREADEAERERAAEFDKGYQGHVKYAAGEVVCLQCHEGNHHNCPDRLTDGYLCECPHDREEVPTNA